MMMMKNVLVALLIVSAGCAAKPVDVLDVTAKALSAASNRFQTMGNICMSLAEECKSSGCPAGAANLDEIATRCATVPSCASGVRCVKILNAAAILADGVSDALSAAYAALASGNAAEATRLGIDAAGKVVELVGKISEFK